MKAADTLARAVMADLRGRKAVLDDVEPDTQEEIQAELAAALKGVLACTDCGGTGVESYGNSGDVEAPSACMACRGTGINEELFS